MKIVIDTGSKPVSIKVATIVWPKFKGECMNVKEDQLTPMIAEVVAAGVENTKAFLSTLAENKRKVASETSRNIASYVRLRCEEVARAKAEAQGPDIPLKLIEGTVIKTTKSRRRK